MKQKVVIRYASHKEHDMVDRTVMVLNPGTKKAGEIKHDLNVFFTREGLPYYAASEEE